MGSVKASKGVVGILTGGGDVPGLNLSPEELEAKQAAVDLYNEGAQAFNAGDLEAAAAKFDAAIAEDPELIEAYDIASALQFKLENYDRSMELVDGAGVVAWESVIMRRHVNAWKKMPAYHVEGLSGQSE